MTSPDEMMAAVTRSMRERTGRTVEEWVGLARAGGLDPLDQKAVRRWPKQEQGLPQNSQWAIADAAARAAAAHNPPRAAAHRAYGGYIAASAGKPPRAHALSRPLPLFMHLAQ